MGRKQILVHEFVDYIPDEIKDGIIYISILYATAVHKCCCGCGNEVVTPISPTDWQLSFDGQSVSLFPSIGNWSFDCNSHYWIIHNRVRWARRMTLEEIEAGRVNDQLMKLEYSRYPLLQNRDHADPKAKKKEKIKSTAMPKKKLKQKSP
ncbi:MAG TPA: DUF6527 family protein [Candidatus Hydrogenedentes bacterium]|nr:DUF6527 family protein [Candidatus Hydrogenedentota bacterium]